MKSKHRNLRKAAVLMASLDADNADALMRQMSPAQAELVRQAVEELGPVDPREQDEVIREFFRIGPMVPLKQPSGIELDARLPHHLSVSRHAQSTAAVASRSSYGAPPFKFLHEASPRSLAPFLEREHPQTVAVVVSHLPAERAADVLASLPPELQVEVARRLVDLDETDADVLREVERGLESWLCEQVRGDQRRSAGMNALQNILSAASPTAKQHILANLNGQDQQFAGHLAPPEPPPLSFADLELLDASSLTVVLHHADPQLVVLALAGASLGFCERVFALFPQRDAERLRQSLRMLGPTRLSDVEDAQDELAEIASQLEVRGEIAPDVRDRLSIAV